MLLHAEDASTSSAVAPQLLHSAKIITAMRSEHAQVSEN